MGPSSGLRVRQFCLPQVLLQRMRSTVEELHGLLAAL